MLRKSARSHSARHLSDDYVWDSLSPLLTDRREYSPTLNQNANTQTAASTDSTSGLPILADHPGKQKLAQAEILLLAQAAIFLAYRSPHGCNY